MLTDYDLAGEPDAAYAGDRVLGQSARAAAASIEAGLAAHRAGVAAVHAVTELARAWCMFGVLALATPRPRFHGGLLPGAPIDATFVEVEGVHVHYRDTGAGPVVVFLHGYGASSDSWTTVTAALAPVHRTIAIDLKGFGWSSRPAGDYSVAAQARLVWRVLDALGVTDAALVGHSWGSSVALAMAVGAPARVRRVALYAAYVYDEQVPSVFRWAERPLVGEALFGLYYRDRLEERVATAYTDGGLVTRDKLDRIEAELARPGTVAAALATARRHHFSMLHRALRSFDRPVLLLWGEDDLVTPLSFGHRLARELANARLCTYPRCGHVPMVEAHAASTRDLAAFLEGDQP